MARKLFIALLLALGLAAAPAVADTPPSPQPEATIPFANHGGIHDWRQAGDRTIYVQDKFFRWYKATLMAPSFDLPTALTIGFDTGATGSLDKFSSIVVRGQHYPLQSLVRIEGKPPSTRKAHAKS